MKAIIGTVKKKYARYQVSEAAVIIGSLVLSGFLTIGWFAVLLTSGY